MNRRQFMRNVFSAASISSCVMANAAAAALHCTPAPSFPIPLEQGPWRSQEFPVGKHAYNVWLNVDRRMPYDGLDCDLGPPRDNSTCSTPPLLDLEWKIWDGAVPVKNWPARPFRVGAWGSATTSVLLGGFEGKRNGSFTFEMNVMKDGGRLKDLHPRVEIVKNPGYWCWL